MTTKLFTEPKKPETTLFIKVAMCEHKNAVRIDSVTSEGQWLKTLCDINEDGIILWDSCDGANIRVDKDRDNRVHLIED